MSPAIAMSSRTWLPNSRLAHLDLLRRFRNGAFHYQRDYFDSRFTDVFSSDAVRYWSVQLHASSGVFSLSGTNREALRWKSSKNQRPNQALVLRRMG